MKDVRIYLSVVGDNHRFISVLPAAGLCPDADEYEKALQYSCKLTAPGVEKARPQVELWLKTEGTEIFVWSKERHEAVQVDSYDADKIESLLNGTPADAGPGVKVEDFMSAVRSKSSEITQSAMDTASSAGPYEKTEWEAPEDAAMTAPLDSPRKQEEPAKEEDPVDHPAHYCKGGIECIDVLRQALSHEEFCGFLRGNVIKYHFRALDKGGLEDIRKAGWYQSRLEKEFGSAQ